MIAGTAGQECEIGKGWRMKTIESLEAARIDSNAKVLFVFAHPDDESVFAAGLIQRICRTGGNVRLICLTRGQAGSLRYGLNAREELGTARSRELQRASTILGLSDCRILSFSDGRLSSELQSIEDALREEISEFEPDMVVTFEPEGITGHRDHRAASRAVTDLFPAEAGQFQLVYAAGHRDHTPVPRAALKLILRLSKEEARRKIEALETHQSQFRPGQVRNWFASDQMEVELFYFATTS
jgi:LmbE family N-acetylglucosaminyl deacetylase